MVETTVGQQRSIVDEAEHTTFTCNFKRLPSAYSRRNPLPGIIATTGFSGRIGIRKQHIDAGAVAVHRDVIVDADLSRDIAVLGSCCKGRGNRLIAIEQVTVLITQRSTPQFAIFGASVIEADKNNLGVSIIDRQQCIDAVSLGALGESQHGTLRGMFVGNLQRARQQPGVRRFALPQFRHRVLDIFVVEVLVAFDCDCADGKA